MPLTALPRFDGEKVVATTPDQRNLTTWYTERAVRFIAANKERPFFRGLVEFMSSGPVVVQVLEGDNAVARNREAMGATDPKKAAPGTIRAQFAEDIEANSVHGSDSVENAAIEIGCFFAQVEIVG